ncbi:lyase family protein [uncultured Erythrobacter sp.]|uniref:lyase family protein n=1 Tax=uncultured Erythrobacter sp. TaxID=263913 RepID=UPI00260B3B0D|nr:lyase family protein [uncultured Erythrobacter sp.]
MGGAGLNKQTGKRLRLAAIAAIAIIPSAANACSISSVDDLFAYKARTQAVLDVEAAMARAQAANGVIPHSAADEISEKARVALVPQAAFDVEYAKVRHRMVALLNVWRESLGDEADQYVHFGATTVDIYGTATMMQIDSAIVEIDGCMAESIAVMSRLADDHKATPMIGRTLGQHAQPITFGKKVSTWIGEYARHRDRLAELRARVRRSAILKGAVGNYSGLGDKAILVERSFAEELGFDAPYPADWNGTRDVIAEYGLVLGMIAKSHQRFGQEVFLLQGTDIGELSESLPGGTVGSSSMPHKRNPRVPERLIHAGRTIPRLGEVLADDVVNFFERDNTSRLTPVIEEISVESARALRNLNSLLDGLQVEAEQMRANIDRTRGFAMSQRVAFALAEHMPRADAEALVKQVIAEALAADQGFAEALRSNPQARRYLGNDDIARLLDPDAIDPAAIEQVESTIAEAKLEGAQP